MAKKAIRPIRIEGNVAYVPLTKGYEAVIDASDVPLVEGRNWVAQESRDRRGGLRTVYAVNKAAGVKTYLHRAVVSGGSMMVDHINGDGLDNRRRNLRLATNQQNSFNQRLAASNTSGFKGVHWAKRFKTWSAYINIDGRRKFLGNYDTAERAAEAYAKASAELHGSFGQRP